MNSRRIHWLAAASLLSPSFVTAQSSTPFVEADFKVPEKR
jgi:hypothetical protein